MAQFTFVTVGFACSGGGGATVIESAADLTRGAVPVNPALCVEPRFGGEAKGECVFPSNINFESCRRGLLAQAGQTSK